jgi:hypothetical protein
VTPARGIALAVALAIGAAAASADDPESAPARKETPRRTIGRLPEGVAAPRIDARLDDEAWDHAGEIGEFTQVVPIAGAAPSERTRIRVLYDARTLYFALECFDREPHLLRATQMQRDANLDPDERVEILIDSFLDRRNAFWFQIGAAGSLGDALVTRNGATFNKQWDGIWNGEARIDEDGWRAELAIPFATLNFDPKAGAWGLNLRRFIRRRNEEVRWASADPRINFFWVANCGELSGFEGLHQGLGLDFTPFAVARARRDSVLDRSSDEFDAGFDAFYRLTPSAKLALSLNTDFAEVEVDQRQVNLTRFPLFFPEQRDFFLEDSGVFQFGNSGQLLPFFSRRIGLDAAGQKVPILAAAKLTGQTDGLSYGLLDVQTDSSGALDSQNLFAGRISKNIFEQSDVGVIWTSGDPRGGGDANTVGVDLNLRTNDFLGDDTLRWQSFVVGTENEGSGDADLAYSARLTYPNDQIEWSVGTGLVEEDFAPRLGFVDRTGVRRHDASYTWRPRINREIRQLEFQAEVAWVENIGAGTQTLVAEVQPFGLIWDTGDEASFTLESSREALDTDFDIHPDASIGAGDYTFERVRLDVETSDHREFSLLASASAGEFFDGESESYQAQLDWRQSAHFLVTASYEHTDARLAGGDFTVDVGRLRFTVLFTPRVSWSNNLQWDDVSDNLALNSRLWWIFAPGVQSFLVLNQGWNRDPAGFEPLGTELALKFGYTLRF